MKGCSVVYHCAAVSGIVKCEQNRRFAYKVNVEGTRTVVESAEKHGVRPVLFSSQAVFGDSYYGETKKQMEEELEERAVIFRMSNVYGGLNYHTKRNVLWHFMHDNPIVLHGEGQTRDFVHVSHVLDKCLMAPRLPFGIYEVQSGVEIPIETLAQLFAAARDVPLQRMESEQRRLKQPSRVLAEKKLTQPSASLEAATM
jgi:nucleoside-diphosphate-sugar epimerase